MSQPRSTRKRKAQQQRTKHREAKQRASYKAETKRQRTRAQTPELWRSRVKGRAVKRSGMRSLKRVAVALPRWTLGRVA